MSYNYEELNDIKLIELAREGSENAKEVLISRYKKMVRAVSRTYFILGSDKDDIIQEGMIGLFKALNEFDINRRIEFSSFAKLCVTRQIMSAIKSANRQKHIPLNTYLSFSKSTSSDGANILLDEIQGSLQSPEQIVIDKENRITTENNIKKNLSKFENTVLQLYLEGNNYAEIAGIVLKDEKSIDNAIQRIRKKVTKMV